MKPYIVLVSKLPCIPIRRGGKYEEVAAQLQKKYGGDCTAVAFQRGYERGQQYYLYVMETYEA